MLIGCFINSFKSYKSTEYINLTNHSENLFTSIIGSNGAGKSTILEAVNFFFKQGDWISNKQSGNNPDSYITCIFKIEKSNIIKYLSRNLINVDKKLIKDYIERHNNFITTEIDQSFTGITRTEQIDRFITQIKNLNNKSENLIVAIGRDLNGKTITKPFSSLFDETITNKLFDFITSYYNYIYIPATSIASDVLKIHGIHMQNIMNKDVVDQIAQLLNRKVKLEDRNKSILDHVNKELNAFVEEINLQLKKIDKTYEFKTQPSVKRNVTSQDVTENIIQAFFEKRLLRVSGKDVKNLSSGEQRKAIIDVIYSFLKNKVNESEAFGRNIIFAIDEPELSQDANNCHEQFDRLYEMATHLSCQVILTTHWYGLLPIIDRGTLIHINENERRIFNFFNFLDQREHFPDDLNMKSLYDLSNSIRNYLRSPNAINTLICEGGTDKIYIETFTDKEKIKIIPCGGKDNVIILYKLLSIAINSDSKLSASIKNKVLFLIDTDQNITKYDEINKSKNEKIDIRRLQINGKNKQPSIISVTDTKTENHHSITRIEDVLDAKTYFESLEEALADTINISDEYDFIEGKFHSRIDSSDSIIYAKTKNAAIKLHEFIGEISKNKTKISKIYERKFKEKLDATNAFNNFKTPEIFDKYFNTKISKNQISDNKLFKQKSAERLATTIQNYKCRKLNLIQSIAYKIDRVHLSKIEGVNSQLSR